MEQVATALQGISHWFSPALLLVLGIAVSALGWVRSSALHTQFKKRGTQILQLSVIALGFKIPLAELIATSRSGIAVSAVSVSLVLVSGYFLSRFIRIPEDQAILISSGTAICGGSAIAAVSGNLKPKSIDMGIALAIVFLLNAAGLILFPPIGVAFSLNDTQFATWAALAIHDTSSVVGAASQWGENALKLATTIKLSRTLWIFPMVLGLSAMRSKNKPGATKIKAPFPLFILGFIAASALRSLDTPLQPIITHSLPLITPLATIGFGLSLGLIGLSISRDQLKTVNWKPAVFGIILWVITAGASLLYVKNFV